MIRKIKYSLLPAVLVLGLFSCQKEQDNVFESNAATRIDQAIKEYKEALESSENGWVLQYYPGSDQDKGGYNYYVKFKDFNLADVILESGEVVESEYQIHQNGGVVLSFVTYSDKMHFFATPTAGRPQGYQGDYEFTFVSKTENTIHLKGVKYRGDMILTKLKGSNQDYINKVKAVKDQIDESVVGFLNEDGTPVKVNINTNGRTFNESDNKKVSFVYTETGIHFYEPVTINGVKVQDLNIVEAEDGTKKLVSADGKFELIFKKGLPVDLRSKTFIISYPRNGVLKNAWDEAIRGITELGNQISVPMFLDKNILFLNGGHFYIFTHANTDNSGRGWDTELIFDFTPSLLGDSYMEISYTGRGVSDYIASFVPKLQPLIDVVTGTFLVEELIPGMGYYSFTKVDDPTVVFLVYSTN